VSDVREKAEKLIEEARVLLKKAQASQDQTRAVLDDMGISDFDAWHQDTLKKATPQELDMARQMAQARLEAIERDLPPPQAASAPASNEPRKVKKFRRMI
jgi:hypothetical protein